MTLDTETALGSDHREAVPPDGLDRWKARLVKGVASAAGLSLVGCDLYQRHWAAAAGTFGGALVLIWQAALVRLLQKGSVAIFGRYQSKYCQSLEHTLGRVQSRGARQSGPFTLDLEHGYVPLRLSPNSPMRASVNLVAAGTSHVARQIWDFLSEDAQDAPRRLALLGRPGAGKTTLLEHLALTFARGTERRQNRRAPRLLPILFYLRDVRKEVTQALPPSLAELLRATLGRRKDVPMDLTPPDGWFEARLKSKRRRCLVMFDGLDQVADDEERQAVSHWVEQQMQRYPEAVFLLTSRPRGYAAAPCRHIEVTLEIQPFAIAEVEGFVSKWFLYNEVMRQKCRNDEVAIRVARKKSQALMVEIERSLTLRALAHNPLLLTLIATVWNSEGAVPESRAALYQAICEVLLDTRERGEGLTDGLSAIEERALLRRLALNTMQSKTHWITLDEAKQWLNAAVGEVSGANVEVGTFVERVASGGGLLLERERGKYEFCHRTVQEYLASIALKETSQEALLVSHFSESWWEETIRWYAAESDAGALILAGLDEPTVMNLSLANDCLKEGQNAPSTLRGVLEQQIEARIGSDHPDEAQFAAEAKLTRRFDSMVRIGEGVRLDTTLLSCAEYQLFVSESPQHAPLHWQDDHFACGRSNLPVTGTWPEAAQAFCNWLTQRDPARRRYRLPTEVECSAHPLPNGQGMRKIPSCLGYWCTGEDGFHLVGLALENLCDDARALELSYDDLGLVSRGYGAFSTIPAPSTLEQWARAVDLAGPRVWPQLDYIAVWLRCACLTVDAEQQTKLLGYLAFIPIQRKLRNAALAISRALAVARGRDHARDHVFAPAVARARALVRALAGDLELAFDPDLSLERAFAQAITQASALARAFHLDQGLEHACALARDLAQAVALARKREHAAARDRDRDRAVARARALAHAVDCALVRALDRAVELARTLDSDLAVAIDRDRALDRDRDRALDCDRTYAVARAVARALDSNHDRDRDHAFALAVDHARALAVDRALDRALALDSDSDLAVDCDHARALALDRALDRGFDSCAMLVELWQGFQCGNRGDMRVRGTRLPMSMLSALLNLSRQLSAGSAQLFELATGNREVRQELGRSKAHCKLIAEYYATRARAAESLSAWAALYAAREKHGHPGWEGLRLVCESSPPRDLLGHHETRDPLFGLRMRFSR